jgi:pheromone a factor receptor
MRELAFAVACGLALLLLILPAPWHIKSRNSGTLLYIGWAFIGNLTYLVNAIVWNGNLLNPAPVWCDIGAFFYRSPNQRLSDVELSPP